MAICPPKKIDSNITGLRYAKERCLGELPANPVWHPLEPNSYSDFGGQITTVARNPINPSRQRKKGVVTDNEASGGFNQDITQSNTVDVMQGFLFANARERGTTASIVNGQSEVFDVDGLAGTYSYNVFGALSATVSSGGTGGYRVGDLLSYATDAQRAARFYVTAVDPLGVITAVAVDDPGLREIDSSGVLSVTGGSGTNDATLDITFGPVQPDFVVGDVVFASGFAEGANNGLKLVTTYADGVITVSTALEDETPGPGAKVQAAGRQFAADTMSIVMNGKLPRLTSLGSVDFTTFGFIPGEWIYLDGFANNTGFARINAITASYLEFDKTDWQPGVDPGTGVTAAIYFGTVIRNESDPALIVRQTYQIERTLGQDANGTMAEYLVGAVPNEFTLNVAQADKVTVDMGFVAVDNEARDGTQGVKPGTRPSLLIEDAFNTSSDFSRIKLAAVTPLDPNPAPLFAFATDLTLTITNNVSANKAIGILGAFDMSTGTFEVGGSLTAYFASIEAVRAVRNNADITMDFIMVKNNAAILFDVPLLALGNGRLAVEQDQAVTLPLDTSAAENKFGNTLTVQFFPYLPNSAG